MALPAYLFIATGRSASQSGLYARDGFRLTDMELENRKLIKDAIASALGGNHRLHVPNEIKLSDGKKLLKAMGENVNTFYQTDDLPKPVISPAAQLSNAFR